MVLFEMDSMCDGVSLIIMHYIYIYIDEYSVSGDMVITSVTRLDHGR